MKKIIRQKMYETNSSSVHTLSIDSSGLKPSNLPMDEEGYILIDYGSFGKDLEYFKTQFEKLSYLVTCCYYVSSGFYLDDVYENYSFEQIQRAVCEYTGAKGIKILGKNDPDIDHQSQPEDDWDFVINIFDEEQVINFVFNKYVALKTDCD